MKPWHLALFVLVAGALGAARADEPQTAPAELPKAPEGWKYVTGKGGTHAFLFPTDAKGSSTRDQTFRNGSLRFSGQSHINVCTLPDGTLLGVEATRVSGPGLRGLKIADMYQILIDGEKDLSTDVTEPKEFPLGKLKGHEISETRKGLFLRVVFLVVKGRMYRLSVGSPDKDKLTTPTADTFLKSLVLIPKAAPGKGPAKESAPAKPEPGKAESRLPLP